MKDRVTWLLPVKNGMPYLPQTLRSIDAQTYKNWCAIIWDNGSTDGSTDVVRNWACGRPNVRLIDDSPMGLGASLARMVEVAQTDLCARIDADDVNLPDRLERQVAFMSTRPDLAVVGSQMQCISASGKELGLYGQFGALPLTHAQIVVHMLAFNSIAHPSVMFRRELVLRVGNFIDTPYVEDYDLWLRLAQRYKLANMPNVLVNYRVHQGSVTQRAIAEGRLRTAMNSRIIQHGPAICGLSAKVLVKIVERQHYCIASPLFRIAKQLSEQSGESIKMTMRSDAFLGVGSHLAGPYDVISRFLLAMLNPRRGAFRNEARTLLRNMAASIHLLALFQRQMQLYRNIRLDLRDRQQIRRWRRRTRHNGASVHTSVDFRGEISRLKSVECGDKSVIERGVMIWCSSGQNSSIISRLGARTYIGPYCYIAIHDSLTIEDDVMIGAFSYITSATHGYSNKELAIQWQPIEGGPVSIQEGAWLGTHVVVLPGVTVGRGAIIGAGSVVTKNIPPFEVWGGVPARFLKKRPDGAHVPVESVPCE